MDNTSLKILILVTEEPVKMISTGKVYEQVDCMSLDQVRELLRTKCFGLH